MKMLKDPIPMYILFISCIMIGFSFFGILVWLTQQIQTINLFWIFIVGMVGFVWSSLYE